MNIANVKASVKQIDPGKRFQIYKELCSLAADYDMALRAVDLRVMGEVLSYLNHESYTAFPGINTLLNVLPISRRTLLRSLKMLESREHIARRRRWNKAKGKSDSTANPGGDVADAADQIRQPTRCPSRLGTGG